MKIVLIGFPAGDILVGRKTREGSEEYLELIKDREVENHPHFDKLANRIISPSDKPVPAISGGHISDVPPMDKGNEAYLRGWMVDGKFRYISRVSGAVEVAPNDPSDIRESCI